jgi:hypothetical protein
MSNSPAVPHRGARGRLRAATATGSDQNPKEVHMTNESPLALTPEQWEARDYRQTARDLDRWAEAQSKAADDDTTEYVAKLGLDQSGSVIIMNRAHDRVLVPPPARPALAAFALAEQPFGFRHSDVSAVVQAAERAGDSGAEGALRDLAGRLRALLPPVAAQAR